MFCDVCFDPFETPEKLRIHKISKHGYRDIDGHFLSKAELTVDVINAIKSEQDLSSIAYYFRLKEDATFRSCFSVSIGSTKNYAHSGDVYIKKMVDHIALKYGMNSPFEKTMMNQKAGSNKKQAQVLKNLGIMQSGGNYESYNEHSLGTIFEALFYHCYNVNKLRALNIVEELLNIPLSDSLEERGEVWMSDDIGIKATIWDPRSETWIDLPKGMVIKMVKLAKLSATRLETG